MALLVPKEYRHVVSNPNLGLYLDRPRLSIPPRGLASCNNVRIREGRITNANMGWSKLGGISTPLNGQVLLGSEFGQRSGTTQLILGTLLDLYEYNPITETVTFITPIYNNGTVAVTNGSKTITFTCAPTFTEPEDIKAGDFIFVGASDENDPASDWLEIDSVNEGAQTAQLVEDYAGSTDPAAVYTVRHVFTGDASDIWSADVFPDAQPSGDDLWFATNGNELVKWNGTDDTVTALDYGWTCRGLRYWKNMLLYFDITESGEYRPGNVINSAIGSPEETAADEAGEFSLGRGIDPIVRLEPLGEVLVAYLRGSGSIEILEWIDAPVYWAIRSAAEDVRILSARSLVNQGDHHKFLSDSMAYRFDGVQLIPTGLHVFREALRSLDTTRKVKALAYVDRDNAEAIFVIPRTTDSAQTMAGPKTAFVEHYLEPVGKDPSPITMRDLPATMICSFEKTGKTKFSDLSSQEWQLYNYRWNDRFFSSEFPEILFGTEDGYVYKLNSAETQDGAETNCNASFARATMIDGLQIGVLQKLYLFMGKRTSHENLYYFIYGQNYPDAGTWGTNLRYGKFDLSQSGPDWVKPRMRARFADIGIVTSSTEPSPWECSGYATLCVERGSRL